MNTPTHNANTLRTAVLDVRPTRRRTTTDWLKLLAELDETSVMQNFDREAQHAVDSDFAPTSELSNDEKVEFIISEPPPPKGIETILDELSEIQVSEPNSDYASYEIIA